MTEAVRKGKTIKSSNRCYIIVILDWVFLFFGTKNFFFEKQPIGNLFEDFSQFVTTYVPSIHDGTFCVFTMFFAIFAFSVYSTDYFILKSIMYRNF